MDFKAYLKNHIVLTDGAMGTYYGEKYQRIGRSPELVNRTHPQRITAIHKEYLDAGAQLLRTNSFSSNLQTLFGGQETELSREQQLMQLEENVRASYRLAKEAIAVRCAGPASDDGPVIQFTSTSSAAEASPIWIAGDIGPIPEQRGKEPEELLEEYRIIGDALLEAGANVIWFETFSDYQYLLPVAEYLKQKKDIFVMASFCLNKFGSTRSGISAGRILKTAREHSAIDGVGFNCGIGSTHMYQILKTLDFGDLIVSVIPNSGYPDIIKDRMGYQENRSFFCENMQEIAALGVNLIGGCCGTTPAYIRALKKTGLGDQAPFQRRHKGAFKQENARIAKENNLFYQKLSHGKKVVVVELDPPHDGNCEKLIPSALQLKEAGADLVTFSDSPMGKLRADAIMTGAKIQREVELPVMPHITCRDKNRLGMGAALLGAHMNGIRNLLLITGDPVSQGDLSGITPVFDFNSIKLMEYVQQMNAEYFREDPMVYGGALNYGRANLEKEISRMRQKCAAGADYFLTQPIFDQTDVERIAYIKTQVETKILCGIMPLVSYRNANFMKNEVFGIRVPEEIVACYHKDMSREQGEETGIAIALRLAEQLAEIGDGYYFMAPFNRAAMIATILKRMREQCLI